MSGFKEESKQGVKEHLTTEYISNIIVVDEAVEAGTKCCSAFEILCISERLYCHLYLFFLANRHDVYEAAKAAHPERCQAHSKIRQSE